MGIRLTFREINGCLSLLLLLFNPLVLGWIGEQKSMSLWIQLQGDGTKGLSVIFFRLVKLKLFVTIVRKIN